MPPVRSELPAGKRVAHVGRENRSSGDTFIIHPGDILLAEDTTGSGHSWRLTDGNPWRRAYVILADGAAVPFEKA